MYYFFNKQLHDPDFLGTLLSLASWCLTSQRGLHGKYTIHFIPSLQSTCDRSTTSRWPFKKMLLLLKDIKFGFKPAIALCAGSTMDLTKYC